MIAKKFRFHGYGSLKLVYSKGKTARVKFLSLKYVPNSRRQSPRFAVVVSKKVTKKAPVRNKIRRRIYEIARPRLGAVTEGKDLVVTVFDERVSSIASEELCRLIEELFSQAGITKE